MDCDKIPKKWRKKNECGLWRNLADCEKIHSGSMNCDAINADNGDYEEIQIKLGYNPIF